MRRLAVMTAVALGGAAQAAVPPVTSLVAEADYQVQVVVKDVAVAGLDCMISGGIARIFRDRRGDLSVGMPVRFRLPCAREGTGPEPGPAGKTGIELETDGPEYYFQIEWLDSLRVVEVYLRRVNDASRPFEPVADRYYFAALDAPTDTPVMNVPDTLP